MENKKRILNVLIVILILFSIYIGLRLKSLYDQTYSFEYIAVNGPTQQQKFEFLNKERDNYIFSVQTTSKIEKTTNVTIWEENKFFKNRYNYIESIMPENEENNILIDYFQGRDKGYVVVYGYNKPEELIEIVEINVNGELKREELEAGIFLEIYETDGNSYSLENIKYKDN
ncbi:hypothetical protein [Miniphocaeibacter halophilus]|uniref:Uncharacterized protein n=1 Tax=Miniphocaeibacter halophilus TaxID=2931922 RepID=A0AC61NB39_9FIRM|nr:hypothetical protein [Miniphocaeibacter halophilus]QQK08528.1 hypothetical protein JFY71_03040 [Miniphocaeibacter halophilus]